MCIDLVFSHVSSKIKIDVKSPMTQLRMPRNHSRATVSFKSLSIFNITDLNLKVEMCYNCELHILTVCGARYKTRPGLTYHYTHSHKEKEDEEEDEMAAASPKRDEGPFRKSKYYPF